MWGQSSLPATARLTGMATARRNAGFRKRAVSAGLAEKLKLQAINVVLIATYHSPSVITPGFLSSQKIISRHWLPKQTIITPIGVSIVYNENVSFTGDQNRLEIKHEYAGDSGRLGDVFRIADRLVFTLPHVPYRQIGMNWFLVVEEDNASSWIVSKFMKESDPGNLSVNLCSASVTCQYELPDCKLNIGFTPSDPSPHGDRRPSLINVNVNFHHDISSSREAQSALACWKHYNAVAENALNNIFGSKIDEIADSP